ncbi:hypothetical protein [Streptomyces carpaticus]|uniref:hypothetical protein n=1 Tax=Streptomyces carpaticus TaxID=285558 RepID=UPI0031F79EB1
MPHWPGAGADSLFSTVNPFPQGANVTYASVRNADLGPLDSTVTSLATLTAKLGEMEQDAAAMNGMAHGSLWTGLNATVSKAYIHRTAGKFTDAHTQAEALHSILRDLLTDLRGCQDGLLRLEANSEAEGFRISPEGVISSAQPPHLRLSQLNAGVGTGGIGEPDPEGIPPETQQAMWHAHTRINEIIEKAGESDTIAARALTDLLAEGNGRFVHTDLTGIDDARENQVQQDAEAVTFLAGKENKTAADWRMLGDYFALHADNPEFAHYVVDTIGMENYLALAQELDHTEGVDAAPIRTGMANTLNTAMSPSIDFTTHPPGSDAYTAWLRTEEGQAYERRLNALHTIGPERMYTPESWIDPVTDDRNGYDFFLDLMESADGPMHDVFYYDMLDGMVAAEKTNAGIWMGDRYPDTDTGWDPKNNGTDRLLALGARDNVEATTHFFDPDETDNLDYFIGDGEDSRTVFFGSDMVRDFFNDRTYEAPGLTAALEVAATGRPGGSASEGHSDANIRIAEKIWNTYGEDPTRSRGDHPAPDMRPTLGVIAADYIADITHAVSDVTHSNQEANFSNKTSILLHEIGKNEEAYRLITAANLYDMNLAMDEAVQQHGHNEDRLLTAAGNIATRNGHVSGILTDAYATGRYQGRLDADAAANASVDQWEDVASYLLGGAVYGSISASGQASMTDTLVQEVNASIFDSFRVDNSISAAQQESREYSNARTHYVTAAENSLSMALDRAGIDASEYEDFSLVEGSVQLSAGTGHDIGTTRIERPR